MKALALRVYRRLRSWRAARVGKLDFRATYPALVKSLRLSHGKEEAMKLAVGGEFEAMGLLELEALKHFGLGGDSYLIDVGCGSGRLAVPLSGYLKGRYLGTDVVPELVEYARRVVGRPDWRFETAEGLSIREADGVADVVCFFSVFTHLLHEQTYAYLREAKRVLKPGGKVVFSFLDFTVADHWHVFEFNLKDLGVNSHPLNVFIGKDTIRVWAEHLGLHVEAVEDGDKRFIPLSKPVVFDDGSVAENFGTIGQSVCVLLKGHAGGGGTS
jgi:SAM-dependent methyltransferase